MMLRWLRYRWAPQPTRCAAGLHDRTHVIAGETTLEVCWSCRRWRRFESVNGEHRLIEEGRR